MPVYDLVIRALLHTCAKVGKKSKSITFAPRGALPLQRFSEARNKDPMKIQLDRVEDAIKDFKEGKFMIVVDD